ncbi:MAG: cereblon family protein [Desulfosalsimonadaceae bacterium]
MKSTVSGTNRFVCRNRPTPSQNDGDAGTGIIATEKSQTDETFSDDLLCRRCGFPITSEPNRIAVNGAHYHTFANPHGIVYEIACFRSAAGCTAAGRPTSEFSWFPPRWWQVAVCGSCMTHMGWRFSSPDHDVFFGLIIDRLIKSDF